MKINYFFAGMSVAAALLLVSCKKEDKNNSSNPVTTPAPVSINSNPQVSYTLDGVAVSGVSGSGSTSNGYTASSSIGTTTSTAVYGSILSNMTSVLIIVEKGTLTWSNSSSPDSAAFVNFFTTGFKAYSANAVNGMQVSLEDAAGVTWSSGLGPQTGSSFEIQQVKQEWNWWEQYMKIKANFNCILYNAQGASKTLTDGVFVGHFKNM